MQTPKTEDSRCTVPAMNKVVKALKKQRKEQLQQNLRLGDKWQPLPDKEFEDLIFTTIWGKPIDRNSVNRTIKSIVNDYNKQEQEKAKGENREPQLIGRFSAHTMRHMFATRCFEQGVPAKVVQSFLGHSTLEMTMMYTHVTKDTETEEIQKLEAVF